MKDPLTYKSTGVSYDVMDPFKRRAQQAALETINKLYGGKKYAREITSLGESAFVWSQGNSDFVFVVEGLGTKNLVADEMYKLNGRQKSYYDAIAWDTVAAIINDIITVGAKPLVVNAYFGLGSSEWLKDEKRSQDLLEGWKNACLKAGAVYGGGETPTLSGIINPDTVDLAGSCFGIIEGREIVNGDKLGVGDRILLIESNGIHANGLTLARKIAEKLPDGYLTKMEDGQTYGEALLKPTHIYATLVQALFEAGVDIHYMVNITGHGWRKLMRAKKDLSYVIESVPVVPELFKFIQEKSGNLDEEMYGNFNMGAGFAIYLPEADLEKAQEIAKNLGFQSWNAGHIEQSPKKVVIKPKNITFEAESLGVR